MSAHHSHPRRRRTAAAATLAFSLPLLAGCNLIPGLGGDGSVSYNGSDSAQLQSATVQFAGQGTFVEMFSDTAAEYPWFGSGFFITPDGIAMTNNHVVAGAGTLSVTIGGDTATSYPAKVLSTSECLDIAVVKVDLPKPVPYFGWASGTISTGSDVYSLGYPLGDPAFSMTRGVVVKSDYAFDTFDNVVAHGLQTDAQIRGGNSGGPLVNAQGKVLGVNFFGAEGIASSNFAVGRDDILPVLDDLKAGKSVLSLGLNLAAFAPDPETGIGGVWVQSVAAGSAADGAGVQPGDVLLKLGGVSLAGETSLSGPEHAGQGTMKHYCDVLKTNGVDAAMDLEVYRPSTDQLLDGQVNGNRALEVTQEGVFGGTVTESDYTAIQSDDGRIVVSVPSEWTQQLTTPTSAETQLQASSDLASFSEFAAPGVEIHATAYQANGTPADVLDQLGNGLVSSIGCAPVDGMVAQDYDDGYYVGGWSVFTACPTGADVVALAFDSVDGASSGYLIIIGVFSGDVIDDPTVNEIVGTFNFL